MGIDIIAIITALTASVETWLPAVISVAGVIISVFVGFARIKRACNDIRSDATIKDIQQHQIDEETSNKEMIRLMKLYMDETHKIRRINKDYDTDGENREEPK